LDVSGAMTACVDVIKLAQALLDDPHWPYHAARALGRATPQTVMPKQYA
jgi:2,4-dienoyl-CoA reductase-like NADH-dependent reductase (Old Yellow Enzyme family)